MSEEQKVAQETEAGTLELLDPEELRGLIRLHRQTEIAFCKETICREVERNADRYAFTDLTSNAKNDLAHFKLLGDLRMHINNQIKKSTTGDNWENPGPWLKRYIDQINDKMAVEVWQKIDETLSLRKRWDKKKYYNEQRQQQREIAWELIRYFVGYAAAWPGKQAFTSRE